MLANTKGGRSAPPRPLSQREAQKAGTRARVVDAARALFTEQGYEAATIRDIARKAGVAPGSVFTTFASKAELLQEIMFSKYQIAAPQLAALVRKPGPAAGRMAELGRLAYGLEADEIRLIAEAIGASWSWPADDEIENRRRLAPIMAAMHEILAQGVVDGEIDKATDLALVVDALFACYLRNFRRARFDGWSIDQLGDRFAQQVALLLAGCRA